MLAFFSTRRYRQQKTAMSRFWSRTRLGGSSFLELALCLCALRALEGAFWVPTATGGEIALLGGGIATRGRCQGAWAFAVSHKSTFKKGLASVQWKSSGVHRVLSLASSTNSDNSLKGVLDSSPSSTVQFRYNATLSFPPYSELMELRVGDCVASHPFTVKVKDDGSSLRYRFRVKLYPRGGGHSSSHSVLDKKRREKQQGRGRGSGFGMSYRALPPWPLQPQIEERVGAYLQFLPDESDAGEVDASYALRLLGRQSRGPRFDVEWRAGMRFVSLERSQLREGLANDFGAHLMQSRMLPQFLGLLDDSDNDKGCRPQEEDPVQLQVQVTIHKRPTGSESSVPDATFRDALNDDVGNNCDASRHGETGIGFDGTIRNSTKGLAGLLGLVDIRRPANEEAARFAVSHDADVRAGRVVVPVLERLSQRPRMFELGVYPGVEYRILRCLEPAAEGNRDVFYSRPGADYELKPIYPLVEQLERPWPVRINEGDIPVLYNPAQYNALSALGSLLTAVAGLLLALTVSQAVSLFFIPSRSMEPTLEVGDVLLVDKVTPRLFKHQQHTGQVVLFHPPERLREIVSKSGGKVPSDRDLFVKRIAAEPGDTFAVTDKTGDRVLVNGLPLNARRDLCSAEPLHLIERYIRPDGGARPRKVPADQVAVLGDCGSVSIDSRVWGTLPVDDIAGRPLLRLWPPSRIGPIPDLPKSTLSAPQEGIAGGDEGNERP